MNSLPMESEQPESFTRRETREVITPFAFSIDESLFGTAIASPWKRGVAMLIDLILIAILSSAGGEVLALAIAITAFRFGSKKRARQLGKVNGKKRRAILRFGGAFIIFVLLLHLLPPLLQGENPLDQKDYNPYDSSKTYSDKGSDEPQIDLAKTLELTGFIIKIVTQVKEKGCDQELQCWSDVMAEVPEQVLSLELSQKQADKLFEDLVSELPLKAEDRKLLASELKASYMQLLSDKKPEESGVEKTESEKEAILTEKPDTNGNQVNSLESQTSELGAGGAVDSENENRAQVLPTNPDSTATDAEPDNAQSKAGNIKEKATKPIYSVVEYVKALIRDLGLGFGWAAFYFTVCGSLFNGKTPGKKLLGIRVIQLDGTRLSIWDSFGRYGGYGAGLATGLLGFIQIYWDANRQAIQDKISATVVIDERKVVAQELVAMAKAKQHHDPE